MVKHQNPEKFNALRGGKMNNAAAKPVAKRSAGALFTVFLIGIATSAAQTPADQARQIELQKEKERECLRQSAARSAPIFIGVPTLTPVHPVMLT